MKRFSWTLGKQVEIDPKQVVYVPGVADDNTPVWEEYKAEELKDGWGFCESPKEAIELAKSWIKWDYDNTGLY